MVDNTACAKQSQKKSMDRVEPICAYCGHNSCNFRGRCDACELQLQINDLRNSLRTGAYI